MKICLILPVNILLQIGKLYFCIEHIIIFLRETVLCGRQHMCQMSVLYLQNCKVKNLIVIDITNFTIINLEK